jgi:hypothetical protein
MNTSWMTPPLNAEITSGWIKDGSAEKTLDAKWREARERNRIAKKILGGMKYSSARADIISGFPYAAASPEVRSKKTSRERGECIRRRTLRRGNTGRRPCGETVPCHG